MNLLWLVFYVACGLCVTSCIGSIVEVVATARFWRWLYPVGPPVLRYELPAPDARALRPHEVVVFRDSRFLPLNAKRVLFRRRLFQFAVPFSTPFFLKGTIRIDQGRWVVGCRAPLFPTISLASFLLGWSAVGGMVFIHIPILGIFTILMGLAVSVASVAGSLRFEIRVAKEAVSEFASHLKDSEEREAMNTRVEASSSSFRRNRSSRTVPALKVGRRRREFRRTAWQWRITPRAKRILIPVAVLAVVNFVSFCAISMCIGGDALNGYARGGHYFLWVVGQPGYVEVGRALWLYSYWHAISVFVTHGALFVVVAVFMGTGDLAF